MTWGDSWGIEPSERGLPFPCDPLMPEANEVWYRGVDVAAPRAAVFRWLCQLKVAPYSYDWIDNWGQTSPRRLTPGAETLEVGQTFMTVFKLVAFETDEHLTLRAKDNVVFPPLVLSYTCQPVEGPNTRLLVKALLRYEGPKGWLLRPWFARADLFMMKKQLKTLKLLAEMPRLSQRNGPI